MTRPLARLGVGVGLAMLAACNFLTPGFAPNLAKSEKTTQFFTVSSNKAWVRAPGALLVTQRELVNNLEQRIGLVNRTGVPGDNLIVLQARFVNEQNQGRFQLDEFRRQLDGLPAPFASVTSGELFTETDDLGAFFWTERRVGSGTVCVLGLRRLDSATRQLPGNANVMDVMLRNCVNGEADTALAPIMSRSIAASGHTGGGAAEIDITLLSPLAGPTP